MSLTSNAPIKMAVASLRRNGPLSSGAVTYNPGFGNVGGLRQKPTSSGAIGYNQVDGVPGGLRSLSGDSGAITYIPGFGHTGNIHTITRPSGMIGRDLINGVEGGLRAQAGNPGAVSMAFRLPGGFDSRGGDPGAVTHRSGFGYVGALGDRYGSEGAITYKPGFGTGRLYQISGDAGAINRQESDMSLYIGGFGKIRGNSGAISRGNTAGLAGSLGTVSGSAGAVTHLSGFGVSGGTGDRFGFNGSGGENRGGGRTGVTGPLRGTTRKFGKVKPRKLKAPPKVVTCCGLPASGTMIVDIEWTHDARGRVVKNVRRFALVAAGIDWTPATTSPKISDEPPGPFAEDGETLEPTVRRRTYNAPWSGCVEIAFDSPDFYGRVMKRTRHSLPATNATETAELQIMPTQGGVCAFPSRAKIKS